MLYFDLERRWQDILSGDLARERDLLVLQPETRALGLVLDIKEERLRTGRYPCP